MRSCAISVLAGLILTILVCRVPQPEGNLEIVVVDVGQGSAVLIRTPDQRTCLIDGGPTYAGANDICPILDSLGITELDYCIATNYTEERIGGLDEVVRYLGGKEGVLFECRDRGYSYDSPAFHEYALAVGGRREKMRRGGVIELGEVAIWCLAANGRVLGSKQANSIAEEDKSIALLLSYYGFDMLIMSDLIGVAGNARCNLGSKIAEASDEVEVMLVGGYGSDVSVNFAMMMQINPVVSVVSAGPNDRNLPAQKTINRLTKRHRRVYQTNHTGWNMIPHESGRIVEDNIWITVNRNCYTVAGDTFRTYR